MIDPATISPAFVVWLAAALALLGRRVGAVAGITACGVASWWVLTVPAGTSGEWTFLEFAIIPVAVDPASRVTGLAFAAFGVMAVGYLSVTGADCWHLTAALTYAGAALGAGVAGVRLRPFLVGTAAGEFPWVIAGVAVGVSVDRLASGDLSALDPALFVGMAGVAALLLAGPFYRAYLRRRRTSPEPR